MDYALSMRDRQNIASQIGDNVLEDLQLEGQRLYRQKQYEDALQCFNKVCALSMSRFSHLIFIRRLKKTPKRH